MVRGGTALGWRQPAPSERADCQVGTLATRLHIGWSFRCHLRTESTGIPRIVPILCQLGKESTDRLVSTSLTCRRGKSGSEERPARVSA
jgi:hypothetical protein